MAKQYYNNADGLDIRTGGPRSTKNLTTVLSTYGAYNELEIDVDLAELGANGTNFTTGTRFSGNDQGLPAYAQVISATLIMSEAAAGGTSVAVGTHLEDGTPVDADGLITATNGALANINAIGKIVLGTGAQIAATGGAPVSNVRTLINITAAGTFTAGEGRLIIRYIEPLAG